VSLKRIVTGGVVVAVVAVVVVRTVRILMRPGRA
jgi:hypothetical protein